MRQTKMGWTVRAGQASRGFQVGAVYPGITGSPAMTCLFHWHQRGWATHSLLLARVQFAEKRDPSLACVAYKRGQCDDALVACTSKHAMFKLQASALLV